MTLIGILSDTHGTLQMGARKALTGCDHIIHAGDIGGPNILHELETLAPVTAVLGNCDYPEYGSAVGRFARPVIDGVRFLVSHLPSDVCMSSPTYAPGEPLPDVCVHGDTHIPKIAAGLDARPASLLLCPGSASSSRGDWPRSIAKMEVEDGQILRCTVESFSGKVLLEWPFAS